MCSQSVKLRYLRCSLVTTNPFHGQHPSRHEWIFPEGLGMLGTDIQAVVCPWREGVRVYVNATHTQVLLRVRFNLEGGQDMLHSNHGKCTASTGQLQTHIYEYTHEHTHRGKCKEEKKCNHVLYPKTPELLINYQVTNQFI